MLTKLLTGNCLRFTAVALLFGFGLMAHGQIDSNIIRNQDSIQSLILDSLAIDIPIVDTLFLPADTLVADTLTSDTLVQQKSTLDSKVEYKADDSIRFDLRSKKVFLYKNDNVSYGSINLQGDYMEIDFSKNEIYSRGVEDSVGTVIGNPVFKESEDEFASKEIRYNFDTKKGLISGVKTEESGGFLHGEKIKKMSDNTAFIQGGRFTTCDLDHPHYAFRFRRSKVIPGDKIITGPAYFEVGNVPTPLLVPFGLFPNQSGKQSGIIIPTYGESNKQGFYFMDGGYYWAVSDYVDLTFLGSIYTRGSWAVNTKAKYKLRYKYSGNLDLKYAINILGSEGSPDYQKSKDFKIYWTHNQDPKARPKSKFSANVNIRSSSFNEFELGNTFNDRLSNTFQSS
ncbi:MAG: LPS-assembly protein LptD, partial [Bacteroidales bacterium]|nr:LPS-assembly protein LptD [Bacteroidales bacterium]